MPSSIPRSVQNLIDELSRLPGIGPKTAGRLTFYLLTKPETDVQRLSQAVSGLRNNLVVCEQCFNVAEASPCAICADAKRDKTKLCVVEESLDVAALDRTGYNGLYHVLGGAISPINGIGPDDLRIKELLDKIKNNEIGEIILATDPSLEGEATAMFIHDRLKETAKEGKLKVTRIARGLPVGGDLEYADEMTLTRALEGRKEY